MRAIYFPEKISIDESLTIYGEKAHHFFNVLRIKTGEKILILSGTGCKSVVEIQSITKKEMQILCLEQTNEDFPKLKIDLVISKLKKEAMDAVLK
jgi:RsmE family RNA methyltransferase